MTSKSNRIVSSFLPVAAAVLVCASGASQAATTWNFNCTGTIATSANWGTCGSSNVKIRGFSTALTDATPLTISGNGADGISLQANGTDGVTGAHAVDNKSGLDALIFDFTNAVATKKVSLTELVLGWNGTDDTAVGTTYHDSDLVVYAWQGTNAPTNFNKTTAGWYLVGDYRDVGANPGEKQAINTAVYSSYWLVSSFAINTAAALSTTDSFYDSFKVLSLAGNAFTPPPGVPEPGSLALLGLGALGLVASRRRAAGKASV